MVNTKQLIANLELPKLPFNHEKQTTQKPTHNYLSNTTITDAGIMDPAQFTRKNLKSALHIITQELKKRGTKTPHIFLPFRSKVNDEKLESFLSSIAPLGELRTDNTLLQQLCSETDEFTLISALKYFWSRLPNNEIIGWDVYLEFKRREAEKGYPKNAFLSIMPKCLSSPAHASIVYDFLDLILSITSNSQFNYLSGRKISKMASFWAFSCRQQFLQSPFYDATQEEAEHNFIEGIDTWKKSTNALFHLVLAFLRSMLPETNSETLKIPKTLQSLLVTTQYPPSSDNESDQSMLRGAITIPCVCVSTTQPSKDAYELISKVRHNLKFDKKDDFLSIENYTILKNLFSKKGTFEIVNSLTDESKRILSRISSEPISSKFNISPGWNKSKVETDPDIPLFSEISIKDVSIHDYYIWTWLASISSDQPSVTKQIFGRSIVVEAEVLGFQKWIVVTEKTLSSEGYLQRFNLDRRMLSKHKRQISMEDYKNLPLPPIPVQETENGKINEESSNKNANEGRKHSNSVSSTSVFSNKKNDMGEFKQNQNVNSARSSAGTSTSNHSQEKATQSAPPYVTRASDIFDKLFSDQFSYIYPILNDTMETNEVDQQNTSSRELATSTSRFTKTTLGDMIAPAKNPVGRKAPPSFVSNSSILEAYTNTPNSQDLFLNHRQSGTPDNTFSPSKSDNNTIDTLKEDKYFEPFDLYHPEMDTSSQQGSVEPYDNYYVGIEAKTSATTAPQKLQPPAATHSQFSQPLQRLPNDILSLPSDSTIVYKDEKFNDDNTIAATPNNGLENINGENMGNELLEEQTKEEKEEELQRKIEEKKQKKKKEKKKLEKQAEAAQLAAAQAAGFPFALLPSNMPPPHIPGMPETPHEKKKDSSTSPKKKKQNSPKKNTSPKNKTPKKVKRIPCDPNKPLPQPTEEVEKQENSNLNSSSATDLESPVRVNDKKLVILSPPENDSIPLLAPPPSNNSIMSSPRMGFVSSPRIPPAQFSNPEAPSNDQLVTPKEQYNIFISQPPHGTETGVQSPKHPYFMQDERVHPTEEVPAPVQAPVPAPVPASASKPQIANIDTTPLPPANQPKPSVSNLEPRTPVEATSTHNSLQPKNLPQPQASVYNATPPMSHPPLHSLPRPNYYQQPLHNQHYFQPMPPHPQFVPRQQQPSYYQQQPLPYGSSPMPQQAPVPMQSYHPHAPPPQQMQYQQYFSQHPNSNPHPHPHQHLPPPLSHNGMMMMHSPQHAPMQSPSTMGSMNGGGANNAVMNMVPVGGRHNKNQTTNKANLRAAFVEGSFGI